MDCGVRLDCSARVFVRKIRKGCSKQTSKTKVLQMQFRLGDLGGEDNLKNIVQKVQKITKFL